MKISVLGSGVIGITSAYYLAKAGHEVTVIDRQPAPGMETSFANAGQISPGYSAPWASPGMVLKAVKWLMMEHRPLVVWPRLDPALWSWMLKLLANCNSDAYSLNKGRMVRLAEYSRDCLKELRAETGIEYDGRAKGTLQMFRKQQQLDAAVADMAILDQFKVPYQLLDASGCIAKEPALQRVRDKVKGGLWLPGDETGDCHKFTQQLMQLAIAEGVRFKFNTDILALRHAGDALEAVVTSDGEQQADAYLLALGSYSTQLLKPLGITIPVYPVKGYSITLPITDPAGAPESTVMDETYKIGVTRLGDRIRVGGTAELAGYNLRLREPRRQTLEFVVQDLFGSGGDVSKAEFWTGLRPMTPDGTPILGPTRYRNLYLATGHGTLGWTMAAGTGRLMADLISGRTPEINLAGLTLSRYLEDRAA